MKNLIGFRQLLRSHDSYRDLEELLSQSKGSLASGREDISFFLVICGDDPLPHLREKNLLAEVQYFDYAQERFSPAQLVKHFVTDFPNGDPIKIIYYSPYAEGLTYPIDRSFSISTTSASAIPTSRSPLRSS